MLKNYLKIAFRNLIKFKTISFIKIIGLAIGTSLFILMALFTTDELSYDSFHKKGDRIYRIVYGNADDKDSYSGTPAPLGPFLKSNFPEISNFTRLSRSELVVEYKNKKFQEKQFFFADPSFFEIFSFPLINGDPKIAMREPNSIVITQRAAKKYFGSENPIGKTISLDGSNEFKVTAIAKDVPANSHFYFDFIIPFERIDNVLHRNDLNAWGNWNHFTYVLMHENTNIEQLRKKFTDLAEVKLPDRAEAFAKFTYQPIKEIHFKYNRKSLEPAFDYKYLVIFIAVAFVILIIACINYINLTTAHSIKRVKEIGMRKIVGANYSELIKQFLIESILLSFIACAISIVMVELILPAINTMTGKSYSISYANFNSYLFFIGLVLFTGILAGAFPAVLLSSFKPSKILKGKLHNEQSSYLRNGLVVFQFTVSIALIICTIIILQQINFIQTKNLGFTKEEVLNIPLKSSELMLKVQTIKEELLKDKNVVSASVNSYMPSNFNANWGGINWKYKSDDEANDGLWIIVADKDFIKTFRIEMVEGADYVSNFMKTDKMAFILNESALKKMDWKTAVGKEIVYWGSQKANIVGVMKDFNFRSLHHLIQPCAVVLIELGSTISIRIRTDNIASSLTSIKNTWESLGTNLPFDYYFLNEDFNKLYSSEIRIGQVLEDFSLITIFVACIGLFGLTIFTAEQRRKELGIRKVLGASPFGLMKLFSFDFTRWVILANFIAWPIAYYLMKDWLQDFAYRIEINWWVFGLSGGIALLIALVTISFQAIKAATANPIESLRYE